jgi:hypothetical protein
MISKLNAAHDGSDFNPLRQLTAAQFAALGGSAVAFVRPMRGDDLSAMIGEGEFNDEETYQLVMSADGTPLLVADTPDAVHEWLGDRPVGLVSLH